MRSVDALASLLEQLCRPAIAPRSLAECLDARLTGCEQALREPTQRERRGALTLPCAAQISGVRAAGVVDLLWLGDRRPSPQRRSEQAQLEVVAADRSRIAQHPQERTRHACRPGVARPLFNPRTHRHIAVTKTCNPTRD